MLRRSFLKLATGVFAARVGLVPDIAPVPEPMPTFTVLTFWLGSDEGSGYTRVRMSGNTVLDTVRMPGPPPVVPFTPHKDAL